jgi:hypothetical protein
MICRSGSAPQIVTIIGVRQLASLLAPACSRTINANIDTRASLRDRPSYAADSPEADDGSVSADVEHGSHSLNALWMSGLSDSAS